MAGSWVAAVRVEKPLSFSDRGAYQGLVRIGIINIPRPPAHQP